MKIIARKSTRNTRQINLKILTKNQISLLYKFNIIKLLKQKEQPHKALS